MEKSLADAAKEIKAVANVQRLKILQFLSNGEKCVNDIRDYLNISQPVTSYHLKSLKQKNLVNVRRDNKKMFYSIDSNSTANRIIMEHVSIFLNNEDVVTK